MYPKTEEFNEYNTIVVILEKIGVTVELVDYKLFTFKWGSYTSRTYEVRTIDYCIFKELLFNFMRCYQESYQNMIIDKLGRELNDLDVDKLLKRYKATTSEEWTIACEREIKRRLKIE